MIGGCGGMQNKDETKKGSVEQSDAAALQDEFTSEFIDTSVEAEKGYLQFKSKLGGYTMLFPENAKLDPPYYEKHGETFETVQFGEDKETNDYLYYSIATYDKKNDTNDAEIYLDLLSTLLKYDGDYDKIEREDKTIYFATKKEINDTNKKSTTYRFFGLVQSTDSNQAVRYEYHVICDNEKECSSNYSEIENKVKKIMESVTFISANN